MEIDPTTDPETSPLSGASSSSFAASMWISDLGCWHAPALRVHDHTPTCWEGQRRESHPRRDDSLPELSSLEAWSVDATRQRLLR